MGNKYGGMKKASDWAYKKVKVTRAIRNGLGEIPEGTTGTINCRFIKNGCIHFEADQCECCGFKFHVAGLSYCDFELIPQ